MDATGMYADSNRSVWQYKTCTPPDDESKNAPYIIFGADIVEGGFIIGFGTLHEAMNYGKRKTLDNMSVYVTKDGKLERLLKWVDEWDYNTSIATQGWWPSPGRHSKHEW